MSEIYSKGHSLATIQITFLDSSVIIQSPTLIKNKIKFRVVHCRKNRPHFTFYTAEATNAILYGAYGYALALRRYDVKLREETA